MTPPDVSCPVADLTFDNTVASQTCGGNECVVLCPILFRVCQMVNVSWFDCVGLGELLLMMMMLLLLLLLLFHWDSY